MRPLHDRVVLERVEQEAKTPGGIFIPDVAKEKPIEATVIACGPGRVSDGLLVVVTVKPGDKVLIGKYAGIELEHGGKKYVVVREDEILIVL